MVEMSSQSQNLKRPPVDPIEALKRTKVGDHVEPTSKDQVLAISSLSTDVVADANLLLGMAMKKHAAGEISADDFENIRALSAEIRECCEDMCDKMRVGMTTAQSLEAQGKVAKAMYYWEKAETTLFADGVGLLDDLNGKYDALCNFAVTAGLRPIPEQTTMTKSSGKMREEYKIEEPADEEGPRGPRRKKKVVKSKRHR